MVWWKNPVYIALMAISGLAVVCFGLSFVWGFFSFIAVFSLLGVFGIPMVIFFFAYKNYRKDVRAKRYTDAYLYAEEQGRPSAIHKFKYPREVENQIKWLPLTSLFCLWHLLGLQVLHYICLYICL